MVEGFWHDWNHFCKTGMKLQKNKHLYLQKILRQKNIKHKKMKKLISLIALTALFGFQLIAQQNNNLVIFSQGGERFYVILNGIKQNASAQTNVKVTGLMNDGYKVKIIFENKSIPDIDKNIPMMWGGEKVTLYEFTYCIENKKGVYKIKGLTASPFA